MIGFGFLEHGYAKLSRGADGFIAILHAMGMPFADLLGWVTILVEVVGGLLILAGALVPATAVPMIGMLLVAVFTVHLPYGFSSIKLLAYDGTGAHFGPPGYETNLLYIAGLLALCFGGAGPLSLDGYLKKVVGLTGGEGIRRAAYRDTAASRGETSPAGWCAPFRVRLTPRLARVSSPREIPALRWAASKAESVGVACRYSGADRKMPDRRFRILRQPHARPSPDAHRSDAVPA